MSPRLDEGGRIEAELNDGGGPAGNSSRGGTDLIAGVPPAPWGHIEAVPGTSRDNYLIMYLIYLLWRR